MAEQALVTTIPPTQDEEIDVHLAARNTEEMNLARGQLREWLTAKIKGVRHDASELKQAYDIAIERKWGNLTLKRHAHLAKVKLTFYQKCLAAVDAGYTIVPNFPVDLFAIRVKTTKPTSRVYSADGEWANPSVPNFAPKPIEEGLGRYVADVPRGQSSEKAIRKPGATEDTLRHYFRVTSYGEVEFPVTCARPVIMEATAQAMALKVFDAIGICPARTIRRDPLIIGQVRMPKSGWGDPKIVSFLIAWHLDLRTL